MSCRVDEVLTYARTLLSCSAHAVDHVMRVYHMSLHLARAEGGVDMDVLEPAVLLHDIARPQEDADGSGATDHAVLGAAMARQYLTDSGYDTDTIAKIVHCIQCHRYRGTNIPSSPEAKILFDADKLDILGAVGLARSYMLAGQFKESLYSEVPIAAYVQLNLVDGRHDGRIKDIAQHSPNIEFETKLRHLPGRLFTGRARAIAQKRLQFMDEFFDKLKRELDGES